MIIKGKLHDVRIPGNKRHRGYTFASQSVWIEHQKVCGACRKTYLVYKSVSLSEYGGYYEGRLDNNVRQQRTSIEEQVARFGDSIYRRCSECGWYDQAALRAFAMRTRAKLRRECKRGCLLPFLGVVCLTSCLTVILSIVAFVSVLIMGPVVWSGENNPLMFCLAFLFAGVVLGLPLLALYGRQVRRFEERKSRIPLPLDKILAINSPSRVRAWKERCDSELRLIISGLKDTGYRSHQQHVQEEAWRNYEALMRADGCDFLWELHQFEFWHIPESDPKNGLTSEEEDRIATGFTAMWSEKVSPACLVADAFTVVCPNCRKKLVIPFEFAGKTGKCNQCNGAIRVPGVSLD